MTQASFSTSGSTQNIWSAVGSTGSAIPAPLLSTKPTIAVVYTSNVFNANPSDSGCTYLVPANGANATINLGVPATMPAGTTWKFIFNANASHTTAFTSQTTSKIFGICLSPANATTFKAYAGASSATATNAVLVGDSCDIWTDQTNFYILAQTQANTVWT